MDMARNWVLACRNGLLVLTGGCCRSLAALSSVVLYTADPEIAANGVQPGTETVYSRAGWLRHDSGCR